MREILDPPEDEEPADEDCICEDREDSDREIEEDYDYDLVIDRYYERTERFFGGSFD